MIVARAQITITGSRQDNTYFRYSNDGGRTFTAAVPWEEDMPTFFGAEELRVPNSSAHKEKTSIVATIPVSAVTPGEEYTLSLELTSDGKAAQAEVLLYSVGAKKVVNFNLNPPGTWTYVSRTFTMPDFSAYGDVFMLRFDNNGAVTDGVEGVVAGRKFRLNPKGADAAAWGDGRNLCLGETWAEKSRVCDGASGYLPVGTVRMPPARMPGDTYTLAAEVRADGTLAPGGWIAVGVGTAVHTDDSSKWNGIFKAGMPASAVGAGWTEVTKTFALDEVSVQYVSQVFGLHTQGLTGTLAVRNVRVVRGAAAPRYAPAPEEQQFGLTPGRWLGVAVTDAGWPPTDVKDYSWSETQGRGVAGIVRYFALSSGPEDPGPSAYGPSALTPTPAMRYLWAFDRITYSDGMTADTARHIAAVYGKDGEDGTSVTVRFTETRYAVTRNAARPADTAFAHTDIPALASGDYLWSRTSVLYSDNQATTAYGVSRIGTDGPQGLPGPNGKTTHFAYSTSADGTANFSTTLFSGALYIGTYDDTAPEDSGDPKKYRWTKLKGDPGKDGTSVKVKSQAVTYAVSASGTAAPTAGWQTAVPSVPQGQYLWTRIVVTYTDGTHTTTYSVARHGANGPAGTDAEFCRLSPVTESAVVKPVAGTSTGTLYVDLAYTVQHVKGNVTTAQPTSAGGYYVSFHGNDGKWPSETKMSMGAESRAHAELPGFLTAADRPDYLVVELRKGGAVVHARTVPVMMEAASYVRTIGDMRTSVSTMGTDISTIRQDARSLTARVENLKTGVRNLLAGGLFQKTFSTFGFTEWSDPESQLGKLVLERGKTYTMTARGHASAEAVANGQKLVVYLFSADWKFLVSIEIAGTEDTVASVTFDTSVAGFPADGHVYVDGFPFPQKPDGKPVTLDWVTVTEGTQAAAAWIPSEQESGEERAKVVEARLENGEFAVTAERTVFRDATGKETVLIKDGKLSAELIDAVKLVALGIRAQIIDAGNATFRNLIVSGDSRFSGKVDAVTGSFKRLDCVDGDGNVAGGISFGMDGGMWFSGDVYHQGDVGGRPARFFGNDIWCRGAFGHAARTVAVVRDGIMTVYPKGANQSGTDVRLGTAYDSDNRAYYRVPLYSPGYGSCGDSLASGSLSDVAGMPVDIIVFNCTEERYYGFSPSVGKTWLAVNGNDATGVHVCDTQGWHKLDGGRAKKFVYVKPEWLNPVPGTARKGRGVFAVGEDLDWQ